MSDAAPWIEKSSTSRIETLRFLVFERTQCQPVAICAVIFSLAKAQQRSDNFPQHEMRQVYQSMARGRLYRFLQGLRASSLQFTSPLEFNAICHDGFTLRLELNGWSKIRDPVTAKFKHVTVSVTCTLLCCDDVTYVPAQWNFQKADLEPHPYGKKYTTFSFPIHRALASNICLRDAPTCSCIQLYT